MLKVSSFSPITRCLVRGVKLNSPIRCSSNDKDQNSTISQDIEQDLKKLKQVREEIANNDSAIYNEYKQVEKGR